MIKIYVACLASYNAGEHFGQWFDLDDYSDEEELSEAIHEKILKNPENPCADENPEEWAIHDFELPEGAGKHISISEYHCLADLVEMNETLNDDKGLLYIAIANHFGFDDLDQAKRYYENNHIGEFESDQDFAAHYAEECNGWDLSSGPGYYIDLELYARDLLMSGFVEIEGNYFYEN
jgi:antirestriction protein